MAKNKTPFRAGRTLDALYENVEILTGQRGGDYKAVTSKEVSALKGTVSTIIRGGITGGSGSGSEEIIERPHAPVNVQGFGGFSSVLLSWDNPTFQGYAHAEVWRSASRNLSQAALIGTTPATVFSDVVDLGTGYYYWVRFVNKNDVAGAYHDVAGIYVETSPDIGGIIDDLANQLVSSDLFQALQSDIDTNRTDLDQAEAELNSSIDAAKDALTAAIARVETERKTADATMSASITELEQVVSDGEGSLVQQVAQIRSDFESADEQISADITEAKKVLTDADSAIAERVNAVEADFKTGDSQLVSLLKELERVTASVSEVIAMAVRQLNVAYQTVSTGEKLVVDAKITETQKVIANAEQALAQQITELEASFQTADATINATITELAQTVSTEDQALSERIDTTSATINGVSATVSSHNQAIANIDSNGSAAYRAMWTQKASAGQVTAGIGLLAGSGGVSQVVVSASQFFVFNPNSPTTKTPLFAIDSGKVVIPEALIEKATIQILNAQTITADYVRSGISITSPAINGGTLTGAVLKVGAGGPYAGYHFYVNSSGTAYLNNATVKGTVVATGGSFSNVVINENCTIRGTLDGADGTFSGTVYAENIVGDIASMREYAYNYRNSTADVNANTWLNVVTVNIDSARPYARKLIIEPVSSGSIFVNMYVAYSGWYNCTYRLVGPTGTVHATYTSKHQIGGGTPLYNINPSVGRVFAEIAANAPAGAYRLQFSCDRDAEYIFVDYNDAWEERRNHILLVNLFKDSGELS
ncbi:DUF1983 domain-containing protein [Vibrio parahaemolyticus]|uniref:phage tail tip fiber protein n=1 Tax=unclassified Vibrio TaxID=2614977 RepID=UPI002A050CE9|nr:DUF1983 domain-containing protein [Vibrio parahaemolyticus]